MFHVEHFKTVKILKKNTFSFEISTYSKNENFISGDFFSPYQKKYSIYYFTKYINAKLFHVKQKFNQNISSKFKHNLSTKSG